MQIRLRITFEPWLNSMPKSTVKDQIIAAWVALKLDGHEVVYADARADVWHKLSLDCPRASKFGSDFGPVLDCGGLPVFRTDNKTALRFFGRMHKGEIPMLDTEVEIE